MSKGGLPPIIDEFTEVPGAKHRYACRQYKWRVANGLCIRCPLTNLREGVLVTRVDVNGVVVQKRLKHCSEHLEYINGRNKKGGV